MPFVSRKIKQMLETEVEKLRAETLRLTQEKCDLELKLFDAYGKEWELELIDILELSSLQKSKLGLLFAIKRARLCGVSEDQILHDIGELNSFSMSRES